MSNMAESGFSTGLVAGGLTGLGIVASRAIDHAVEHQKSVGTIQRWSVALDAMRLRAIKAERAVARQAAEIADLRAALQDARFELGILRNA